MSPKKKKAPAAQKLIDSLLDEKTPAGLSVVDFDLSNSGPIEHLEQRHFDQDPDTNSFAEGPALLEYDSNQLGDLSLESSSMIGIPDPTTLAEREARAKRLADEGDATAMLSKLETLATKNTKSSEGIPTRSKSTSEFEDVTATHENFKLELPSFEVPADNTVRLDVSKKKSQLSGAPSRSKSESPREHTVDRLGATEVKTAMRGQADAKNQSQRPHGGGGAFSSTEAALKQSESLRIAQTRISELESEVERYRRENEKLSSAGETLRRRADELLSKSENLESVNRESEKMIDEEKKVFRGQLQAKERENGELRGRLEELEGRLESNFKKIRVRERELEHRLEITRMESATLVTTKDKMILELKRQLDQLLHENDYGKQKSQELFNQYKEKQETIRRVVRALRIALTILEGDEDAAPLKKAE